MSDNILRLIPTEATYVPDAEARVSAVRLLEGFLPDGEMCEAEVYESVTFIDPGANPCCSTQV